MAIKETVLRMLQLPAVAVSMVSPQLCYRHRFLYRVTWTIFIICFFVVLTEIGILFRLPDSSQYVTLSAEEPGNLWIGGENLNSSNLQYYRFENVSEEWQQANPPWKEYKLLVYSAFWDSRTNQPCVRVIGTTTTKKSPPVMCRLHFENRKSVDISAQKKALNEHWNLKYAGHMFSCCSVAFKSIVPVSVTVFEKSHEDSSVTLTVHRTSKDQRYQGQLALCVKPFHYNFNRAAWLIEFVEYYRMMGVEHFLFYNETVGSDVQDVLMYYQQLGLLQVMQWSMLVQNQKEIRTENMFSALNDCNFRLMYRYKYVVSVDFDEFIVPQKHTNIVDMLKSLGKASDDACTPSYVIQNAFFYLYWENDTSLLGGEPESPPKFIPYLLTQYKTRRLKKPHVHGKRSKYIKVPEFVLEVGNHVTWKHTTSCRPFKVSSDVALLHHYRICEYGGFDCLSLPSVQDRTAHKFGKDLLNRVLNCCENVFSGLAGKCPTSPPLGSPW